MVCSDSIVLVVHQEIWIGDDRFPLVAFPSGRALSLLLDSSFKSSFEEPFPPDHVRPSGEMEDAEPVKGSQSDIDMAHAAEAEVDVVVPKTRAPESPAFLEISEGDVNSTDLRSRHHGEVGNWQCFLGSHVL
ncbi:hypothetical protein MUK42_22231 [Musa troglodytarum]|uniref:Uncharacterized protein n=1 Tax=Musa troglodytarum TaxID=320322 RepID=A0A9E7GEN0_9LILI|nr:hypothetical protein MUK42_22231 [Musa troglodytarum]